MEGIQFIHIGGFKLIPCGCGESLSAEWHLCQQHHSVSPFSAFLSRIVYMTYIIEWELMDYPVCAFFFHPPLIPVGKDST